MISEMNHEHGKSYLREKNWPRVVAATILLLAGLYSGNRAVFYMWQSAMQKNKPYLDILEARFWIFSSLAFALIVAGILVIVFAIRKVNREHRRAQKDE